jgi:hypothetical protein
MQTLMAALQAQSSGDTSKTDSHSTGSASATGNKGRHPNIEADLQSLIQQLTSSTTSTSDTSASDSALSSLQQKFQGLLSALGDSGSNATLGNFLQALASNLQGSVSSGNVVNAQA